MNDIRLNPNNRRNISGVVVVVADNDDVVDDGDCEI